MARFDSAIALATRMIAKNGMTVEWKRIPGPALLDAAKPWLGGQTTPITYYPKICFVPIEDRRDRNFFDFMPDINLQVGALAGMMAPVEFAPNAKDVVMRGNKELRIKNMNLYAPNEQEVLWIIEFLQ